MSGNSLPKNDPGTPAAKYDRDATPAPLQSIITEGGKVLKSELKSVAGRSLKNT